jgi:hypothetical protein
VAIDSSSNAVARVASPASKWYSAAWDGASKEPRAVLGRWHLPRQLQQLGRLQERVGEPDPATGALQDARRNHQILCRAGRSGDDEEHTGGTRPYAASRAASST